uniref:Variant surface glycoprotein 1233 n=1 Tax=Trypanosoma brucei TaxID=5691 RepID=M4TDZ5_9TRYP|nr:variant surface glycoprotein 1233 [Trypanosoma brucei]
MTQLKFLLHAVVATVASVAALMTHAVPSAEFGPAGDAVTDRCKEAAFFKAAAEAAENELQQIRQAVTPIRQQAVFWSLGAENAPEVQENARLRALADYAADHAATAEVAVTTAEQKVSHYQALVNRWIGALVTAENAAALTFKTTGKGSGGASGATATAKMELTPAPDQCATIELKTAGGEKVEVSMHDSKKLKIRPKSVITLAGHSHTAKFTAYAGDTPSATPQNTVFDTNTPTNDVIMLAGSANTKSFHLTTTRPAPRTYAGTPGTTIGATAAAAFPCRNGHSYAQKFLPEAVDIAHAHCEAAKALEDAKIQPLPNSGAELAKSPRFLAIANNLRAVSQTRYDLDKADELAKLQQLIKTAYGEQANAFESKYKTNVGKEIITYGTGSNPDKGSIANLASRPEATLALSFLQGKNLMQKQNQNEDLVAKKAELACTDKGKDDCTSKKCEFKERKCVAKEGVKVEGAATQGTQNTTGSNSFVIRKVPLWLAVLLFLKEFPLLFKYFLAADYNILIF